MKFVLWFVSFSYGGDLNILLVQYSDGKNVLGIVQYSNHGLNTRLYTHRIPDTGVQFLAYLHIFGFYFEQRLKIQTSMVIIWTVGLVMWIKT